MIHTNTIIIILLLIPTFEFIMLYYCLAAIMFTIRHFIIDSDLIDPLALIIWLVIFILGISKINTFSMRKLIPET